MVPNGDNPSTNKKANLLQRKSYPEIVAPVPLRHHALQPELTPDTWIRTPSPSSSRAISPATPTRGGFPRGSRQHYRFASFSSVMDARVGKGGPDVPLQEQGFGRRWLRWMHKNGVKHWVVPCTLLASVLVRWCIGLGSYSGTLTKTVCQRTVLNLPPTL
jgi:alpha-1,3-glucosyltransferase